MTRERFIELTTAEQEPLRRFLLALCGGDRDEAEDIAQEALIKAYLASDSFVERYKFSTWLHKIAYRTFVDHQRQQRLKTELPDEQMAGGAAADEAFRYEALYNAIGQLPDNCRAAILLYPIEGYSISEIASITGSNSVAVRQRLSRGLKRLKTIMQP